MRMDRVLTVLVDGSVVGGSVVGGSVVGVIVVLVGVAVVTASALGQPVRPKCLRCYAFEVARLGWPASAMCLACIQPIR